MSKRKRKEVAYVWLNKVIYWQQRTFYKHTQKNSVGSAFNVKPIVMDRKSLMKESSSPIVFGNLFAEIFMMSLRLEDKKLFFVCFCFFF